MAIVFQQSDLYNGDDTYLVDEIFYSIQTEGVFAGRPAVFVRLLGCNLSCSFCDTPQDEKKAVKMSAKKIVKRVIELNKNRGLVVITGGEPLLHNLVALIDRLKSKGYYIQLETNGSVSNKNLDWTQPDLFAIVSPKTKKIHKDLELAAYAFKYVIKKGEVDPADGLPFKLYRPDMGDPVFRKRIMVSPMFENYSVDTEANTAEAIAICLKFGYYLSIQYHKLLVGIK
jgi:7-carboxy-7-deazaguanine synthase